MSERVYTEETTVRASAEVVWEVLADVAQWPTWTDSVTAAAIVDGAPPLRDGAPPLRNGVQVRIKQPQMPAMTWTVTQLVRNRSFAWTSRSAGVTTVADHRIADAAEGSRVTLEIRQTGPLAGLVHALFGKRTQRYLRMEAAGLKARAESLVPAPRTAEAEA